MNEQGDISVSLQDPEGEVFPNVPLEPFQLHQMQEMDGARSCPAPSAPWVSRVSHGTLPSLCSRCRGILVCKSTSAPNKCRSQEKSMDVCKMFPGGNWSVAGTRAALRANKQLSKWMGKIHPQSLAVWGK